MNNLEQQLRELKNVHLSENERELLRSRMFKVMVDNPALSEAVDAVINPVVSRRHMGGGTQTPLNNKRKKSMIGLIIAGMFALSGGVSFAAENSVPGDVLYPVKIHVNENVEGALHVGAKQDAAFAKEQMERRAEEAQKLAAENRLDAKAKATIAAEVKTHIGDFKKAEATMEADGKDDDAAKGNVEMHALIGAHLNEFLGVGLDAENELEGDVDASTSKTSVREEGKVQEILRVNEENNARVISSTTLSNERNEQEVHARGNFEINGNTTTTEGVKTETQIEDHAEVHAPVIAPAKIIKTETNGSGGLNIGL